MGPASFPSNKPSTGRGVRLVLSVWLGALGVLLSASASTQAAALNIGTLDPSPSKMIKRFGPFADYLRSKDLDIGRIVTHESTEAMAAMAANRQVHVLFETPYMAIRLMDEGGMVPILVGKKSGQASYNSAMVVRADSSIQSIADLAGKVVAFESETSTSSYWLPKTLIKEAGLEVIRSRAPVPGKVAFYFSDEDVNSLAQVRAQRPASAAGMSPGKVPGGGVFRILEPQSVYVPRSIVLVAPGFDSTQLEAVLLQMRDDPGAEAALQRAEFPVGFSRFDGDPVQVMDTTVRDALGM